MQIRTKLPANEGAYSSSNPVICVPLVVRTSDFFVSDAHLGAPDAASSRLRELQLVAWLRTVGPHARSLYLVGDLFDFWFEYRYAVPKGYVRLLGALAELSDQGVEIHLFCGNHDLWYGDYLTQEVGLQLHTERVRYAEFHGLRVAVGHGDGLGPGDTGYKFLRRIFTFPLFVTLFRWIHPDAGIGLAGWLSRGSRARTGHKDAHYGGHEQEALWQWAHEAQAQSPVDLYVFGHRHLPLDLEVPQGARYINLGDWISSFTYLEINPDGAFLKHWKASEHSTQQNPHP